MFGKIFVSYSWMNEGKNYIWKGAHLSVSISTLSIEKSEDGVLGIQTRCCKMDGADLITELWTPPYLLLHRCTQLNNILQLKPTKIVLICSSRFAFYIKFKIWPIFSLFWISQIDDKFKTQIGSWIGQLNLEKIVDGGVWNSNPGP